MHFCECFFEKIKVLRRGMSRLNENVSVSYLVVFTIINKWEGHFFFYLVTIVVNIIMITIIIVRRRRR